MVWFFNDGPDLHREIQHDLHFSTGMAPHPWCHHREAVVSTKQLTVSTISHHKTNCKTELDDSTFILLHVLRGF
jgi:hypothetical protein